MVRLFEISIKGKFILVENDLLEIVETVLLIEKNQSFFVKGFVHTPVGKRKVVIGE